MTDAIDHSTAVVTGGLGFIGSNLARELLDRNVSVYLIDAAIPEYGANPHNIEGIRDQINLIREDIRNAERIQDVVQEIQPNVLFHLAAQLSRPDSIQQPIRDIEINCRGTINLLESIKALERRCKVVLTSSQAVYGVPDSLPLTEESTIRPVDIYGANKRAAELYFKVYGNISDVDTTVLRLTNVYGPRAQLQNPNYGVVNKYIRLALEDESLPVYKPGSMRRDFVYVDDVVDAMVAALMADSNGEVYLVGRGESITILELAEQITQITGRGSVEMVGWPDEWDDIRIGDISVDVSKARDGLHWEPGVDVAKGLEETIEYYESNKSSYL